MQDPFDQVDLAVRIVSHPAFDFQLMRQLGVSYYGGSAVGESLLSPSALGSWDMSVFVDHFASIGEAICADADQSLAGGHTISAGQSYLRSAQHFQAAEYYALIQGRGAAVFGTQSRVCFLNAMELMPWKASAVDLPFGEQVLPCYFFTPEGRKRHRKTVLVVPGIESSGEEQYFCHAVSALQRGYNVMIFQGPGMAGMLRLHPEATMHGELEIPLQVAMDFLEKNEEVDTRKLAVIGGGLGALFAARLTITDSRVKALIVNPPYLNLQRIFKEFVGPRAGVVDISLDHLDEVPDSILAPQNKLFVINLSRRFGVDRLQALIEESKRYAVGDLLYRISCPTLCISGVKATDERKAQAQQFYDSISSKHKHLHIIPSIYGPDHHDNVGNLAHLNQVIFDWLDELF